MTKPVPGLASSYTTSADPKTFTLKLRPDAVLADGTPVTSSDVVFSHGAWPTSRATRRSS